VLVANGARRAMVVHGADGLDELSTTAPTTVFEVDLSSSAEDEGVVRCYTVDAEDLGLARASLDDLRGGSAVENAQVVRSVLGGEHGAYRDVVVLNAAAGLVVAGVADDLAEGLKRACSVIDDGRAAKVLDRLVAVSRDAAAG
jgi:anthranilate phosphoribosyltransferase